MKTQNLKRVLSILLTLVLMLSLIPATVLAATDGGVTLTIIHVNDRHGRMAADPYISQLAKDTKGNVLILDAGDALHGQITTNLSKGAAMVELMNEVGYSAMVTGNHEFTYGIDRLLELSEMMAFPLLAANVKDANGKNLFQSCEIFKMNGVTVGVFGLATPETTASSDPRNMQGIVFDDPVETAKAEVAELKGKGCDIIIALVHLGLDDLSDPKYHSDNLAAAVPGIDVIIDGHSHTALPNGLTVGNTKIAQTGEYGQNVGIVEITISSGNITKIAKLIPIPAAGKKSTLTADESVIAKTAELDKASEAVTSVVVGYTPVFMQGEKAKVRTAQSNLADLITDSMRRATGADMAFMTGGNIRASIDIGNITMGEALTTLPYSNLITTVELTGADILKILEHGVDTYPEAVGHYVHVSGLRFTFDPKAEAGSRVKSVTMSDGSALVPDKTYTVATIDFITAGGDGYDMLANGKNLKYYGGDAEAFVNYLATKPAISAEPENRVSALTANALYVVMPDATHGFTGESIRHAEDELKKLAAQTGLSYKLCKTADAGLQSAYLDEAIQAKAAAVVLWPITGEPLREAAERVKTAGIPLIVYDRLIPGLDPDSEVLGDNIKIAHMAGAYFNNYFAAEIEAGKTIGILEFAGDDSTVPIQRTQGFMELAGDNVKVVKRFDTGWRRDVAREQMSSWLKTASVAEIESIQAVYSHEDEVVLGIMDAIAAYKGSAKLNISLIIGLGGKRDLIMHTGYYKEHFNIDLVTYTFSPAMIREAINDGAKAAAGQTPHKECLIDTFEIDSHTLADYLVSEAYRTRYTTALPKLDNVPEDAWYSFAVSSRAIEAYSAMTANGAFNPNSQITAKLASDILVMTFPYSKTSILGDDVLIREQLAAMLMETLSGYGLIETSDVPTYTDAALIGGEYKDAVDYAYKTGLMRGVGGGRFDPQGVVTRAQMAAVMDNAMSACLAADNPSLTAKDFIGKRIAVWTGTAFEQIFRKNVGEAEFIQLGSSREVIDAVRDGTADATMLDEPVARKLLTQYGGLTILPSYITRDDYGFAFAKTGGGLREQFNTFLAEIKRSGVYGDMVSRWLDSENSPAMPEITGGGENGTLIFATTCIDEPFSYMADGNPAGFDVELALRFAAYAGYTLEIKAMSFEELIPAVQSGSADFAGDLFIITEQRKQLVDFSDPYYSGGTVLVVPEVGYRTLSDFEGAAIGMVYGTAFAEFIDPVIPNVTYKHYASLADTEAALASGEIDALAVDLPIAKYMAARNAEFTVFPDLVAADRYGFAVRKGSPIAGAANEALNKIIESGVSGELERKWFSADESVKTLPELTHKGDFDGSAGTLRFGYADGNIPMSYVDANGKPTGFDLDIVSRIAYELNMTVEFIPMSFDKLFAALDAGEIDMAGGSMSITAERQKTYDFVGPNYDGGVVLVIRKPTPKPSDPDSPATTPRPDPTPTPTTPPSTGRGGNGGTTTYYWTITFNGNGSTGGTVPADISVVRGNGTTLPGNTGTLVKTGYIFGGWALTANATSGITGKFTPTANTTLYAVWTAAVLPPAATPNASFEASTMSLSNTTAQMEYSLDGGAAWTNCTAPTTSLSGKTPDTNHGIQVRDKGDGSTTTTSAVQTIALTQARPPAGVGAADQSAAGTNDGTITGVSSGMEYRLLPSGVWTSCGGTTVSNLAPGTYEVRVKGSGTTLPSAAVSVTVKAMLGGTASVSGTYKIGQKLTVSTNSVTGGSGAFSYQWKAGGADITGANSASYVIQGADAGKVISCLITRADTNGSVTATGQTVPYTVAVTKSGDVTGDTISASPDAGVAGAVITLTYNIANTKANNLLEFNGVTLAAINGAGGGSVTYTVSADDAVNGVITIEAKFEHTDLTPDPIAFTNTSATIQVTYGDNGNSFTNAITTAHSGSGAISYSSNNTAVATVNGSGVVSILKAGTAEITATKAEDATYAEATASYTLVVNKADPTGVTFPTSTAVTYGAALSTSTLTGGTGAGTFAWANGSTIPTVGNSGYDVTFTPTDTNYNTVTESVAITVSQKALTIESAAHTKEYDGNTTATGVAVTLGGIVGTDDVSAITDSAVYTNKNAGTTGINITGVTLTGEAAGNYTVTLPGGSMTVAGITKRPLTATISNISGSVLTPLEFNAVTFDLTLDGLVSGDWVRFSVASAYGLANDYTLNGSGTALTLNYNRTTTVATTSPIPVALTYSASYNANYSSVVTPEFSVTIYDGQTEVRAIPLTNANIMLFNERVNSYDYRANLLTKHYILEENITLSGTDGWAPVGDMTSNQYKFTGNFNGNNKTISDLNISGTNYQSLFSYIETTGVVRNLKLEGSFSGGQYTAGIAAQNYGTIQDCETNINITAATGYSGGIAGQNYGTVKNCVVKRNLTGTGSFIGGAVGRNFNGTVQNCSVSGDVAVTGGGSDNDIGGIAGENSGTAAKITGCDFSGTLTSSLQYTGGIVGLNDGGTVEMCYSTGTVDVTANVWGVGGIAGNSKNNGIIKNCYSTGAITSQGSYVGGILGFTDNDSYATSTISNCYSTGNIEGGDSVGGIAGGIRQNSVIVNCYATGAISGFGNTGGIVGDNYASVQNCVALNESITTSNAYSFFMGRVVGNNNGTLTSNYSWSGMTVKYDTITTYTPSNTTDADGNKDGADLSAANAQTKDAWETANFTFDDDNWKWDGGSTHMPRLGNENNPWPGWLVDAPTQDGSTANPFLIYSEADLLKISKNTTGTTGDGNWTLEKHYEQVASFALTDNWTPIGTSTTGQQFTGTYNGGGHTISGLTVSGGSSNNQGMFGYVGTGGAVKNVGLVGGSITGGSYVGGVAGQNSGTVQNCYATGSVTGSGNNVGGVVGFNYSSGIVQNCYATGSITGSSYVGGVVGSNINDSAGVKNCVALNQSVESSGTSTNIGRVVGSDTGALSGNYAWSGMTLANSSGTETPVNSATGKDGANAIQDNLNTLLAGCPGGVPQLPQAIPLAMPLTLAAVTVTTSGSALVVVTGTEDGYTFVGETVTVTATPDEGWTFSHWEDENGEIVSYDAEYTFTVTGDVTLIAVCAEGTPVEPLELEEARAGEPRKEPDPIIVPDDNDEESDDPDGGGNTPDDDGGDGDGGDGGRMSPQEAIATLNNLLAMCGTAARA